MPVSSFTKRNELNVNPECREVKGACVYGVSARVAGGRGPYLSPSPSSGVLSVLGTEPGGRAGGC